MRTLGYRVTLLSPVHIGNGDVLSPTTEVVSGPDCSTILDVEAALRAFPDFFARFRGRAPTAPELMAHLESQGRLDLARVVRPKVRARDIRLQLRDGRGAPLIPGSTWKGSIRTAILSSLVGGSGDVARAIEHIDPTNPRSANPRFAARGLERKLRGARDDPHHDLLRTLMVTDCAFAPDTLQVVQVRIRSPVPDNPLREEEYWLACEAIAPHATAWVRIGWDDFLLSQGHRGALGFPDCDLSPRRLARICRERALAHIETELHYFAVRSSLPQASNFLQALRAQIQSAEENTIFLRLGYGIGWCGTTGELATPDQRLDILQRFERARKPIGKLGASAYRGSKSIFPKTRRWIVNTQEPLFGWVRLDPDDAGRVPHVLPQPVRLPTPTPPNRTGSGGGPTGARPSPRPTGIVAMIGAVRHNEVKGRFDALLRQVQAVEDPEERRHGRAALADLVRRAISKKDRDFLRREDVAGLLSEFPEPTEPS